MTRRFFIQAFAAFAVAAFAPLTLPTITMPPPPNQWAPVPEVLPVVRFGIPMSLDDAEERCRSFEADGFTIYVDSLQQYFVAAVVR